MPPLPFPTVVAGPAGVSLCRLLLGQSVVNASVVEWESAPEVPVIVKFAWIGGGEPPPLPVPLPPGVLPPPQPLIENVQKSTRTTARIDRRRNMMAPNDRAANAAGRAGERNGRSFLLVVEATVTVSVEEPLTTVIVAGENAQLTPAGAPEQASETG